MEELKLYEDGTFDIKVLKAIEVNGVINVKLESPFGIDNISLNGNKKYMHVTGIPKWKYDAIQSVKRKYSNNYKISDNTQVDLLENDLNIKFLSTLKNDKSKN